MENITQHLLFARSTNNYQYFLAALCITNVFYYNEVEKTEVIFFISLCFCFYLQELENTPRIGKNFNNLYYFQKVKNIREANCKFRIPYDFISKSGKYCNNTFFRAKYKNFD